MCYYGTMVERKRRKRVPQKDKKFARWKKASSEMDTDEVKALLQHIYGERLSIRSSGSHCFLLKVPEMSAEPGFEFGNLMIPIVGGQKVKPRYLRLAYRAAVKLELFEEEEDATEEGEEAGR